jgi:retinol dehydrogenase-12
LTDYNCSCYPSGLGYEGAKHLATFGVSRLIFAVRNIEKGEAAAKKLKQEVPSWKGDVQVWQLDMTSFASVKAFAQRLNTLDRLDILIESAGVSNLFFLFLF